MRRALHRTFAALLVLLPAAASAQELRRREGTATDVWTEPNPGVRYLHRTADAPEVSLHALIVDLRHPGVRVIATPQPERWGTVSDFAHAHEAAVAINGGFWGLWQRPAGVTAGGGAVWTSAEPDPDFGHFGIDRDGRAVVHGPGEGEDARAIARLTDAVSGRPLIVVGGEVAVEILDAFASSNQRQPRTAVGVSRDGRTVVLVVADGRQDHSRGLTLYQLARAMIALGAHRAINLDGGGSSTMYVEHAGGIVSSPSRGRWVRALGLDESETRRVRTRRGEHEVYVRGVEREVMNHLAVIAPPPPVEVPVVGRASALGDGLEAAVTARPLATFVPPASEPVRVGQLREVLYPSLFVGLPILAIVPPLWLWRRRRGALLAPRAPAHRTG